MVRAVLLKGIGAGLALSLIGLLAPDPALAHSLRDQIVQRLTNEGYDNNHQTRTWPGSIRLEADGPDD